MIMRGTFGKTALLAATGLAAAALSTAASASTTFSMAGNDSTSWGATGNTRTYTASDGQTKVKVSSYTAVPGKNGSYTLQQSHLGAYSPGLGVSASSSDAHMVENKDGVDFLVFQFDRNVTVESAEFNVFSYYGQDSDATIGVGSTNAAFNNPLVLTNWSQVSSYFTNGETSLGTGTSGTRAINTAHASGNLLIVAAGIFGDLLNIDNFKLKSLTVNVNTPAVPEPATWAMMIGGFGLIGCAMRRRAGLGSVRFA
jgi:hypothetical protein